MNEVQEKILSIFKEVKRICDNNDLTYFAIGGTCIGAVRHNGFIPWDDDLDIAIPIEQWDLFWECMRQDLPEHYKIYSGINVKHYRNVFSKIHDINTSFIEEAEVKYPDSYKGIFVDIMPIAGIPEDTRKRDRFYRRIRLYYKLNFIRRYPFREMNGKKVFLWIVMRLISPFISFHFFSDRWIDYLKKHPFKTSLYTGYTWWEQVNDNLCFPTALFLSPSLLAFEDTTIKCPEDPHRYLQQQFGDYMTLPPKEERLDHHQVFVKTNLSYRNYYKGGN